MFDITVEDPKAKAKDDKTPADKLHVWQNSWGLSTRTIGVMVMVHGDDKGLIFPPKVARYQVVVIPTGLTAKATDEQRGTVKIECDRIVKVLEEANIRATADHREGYTPGFKFSDWEMKGVPLRLEIGPKDLAAKTTLSVRRDTGVKFPLELDDLSIKVNELLDDIHKTLYTRALKDYESRIKVIREWKDFVPALNNRNVCVIPWCEVEACEDEIKERSAQE